MIVKQKRRAYQKNSRENTIPYSKRIYGISHLIIKDFIRRNPKFYQKNGVPVNYFCSNLNEQIVLLQEKGIIKFWCGYAKDYLIERLERGKIELKNNGIFIKKGEENE